MNADALDVFMGLLIKFVDKSAFMAIYNCSTILYNLHDLFNVEVLVRCIDVWETSSLFSNSF